MEMTGDLKMTEGVDRLFTIGTTLAERGEWNRAEVYYRSAVQKRCHWPEALSNLGFSLLKLGRSQEAIYYLEQAVACCPTLSRAYTNLGVAFSETGRVARAEECLRHALRLQPTSGAAHCDLALNLLKQGRPEDALWHVDEALRLIPRSAHVLCTRGFVLERMGSPGPAIDSFRDALRLDSDHAESHFGLGYVLLLTGEFDRGWWEYEWRWRTGRVIPRYVDRPFWDGFATKGTLVVYCEQGLGDSIQFLRYVRHLRRRKVILEVPPGFTELIGDLPRGLRVVPAGARLGHFDYHIPLLSLARLFGTTIETIPREIPYLRVSDTTRLDRWRRRLQPALGLRVGIAWAGNPSQFNDCTRSIPLAYLAPLGAVSGVSFFSLQKGPASEDLRPAGFHLPNLINDTTEIVETAAAIMQLDLIISVDTMICHLAGALGKPVWTLLSFAGDWRWLRNRNDSPWYPTMRLFRQTRLHDWSSVIKSVASCLSECTGGHSSSVTCCDLDAR